MEKKTIIRRTSRALVSLLLVAALSFSTAFAADETAGETAQNAAQDQTEQSSQQEAAAQETTEEEAQPEACIIKKGKYYYYQKANGKIRKKKGFVTCNGKIYYIKRGGRIMTGKTFRVSGKKYRARKSGVIATGVYKWGGKYYYSKKTGVWVKKERLVRWKGNTYHIGKKGIITVNTAFVYENLPYVADAKGRLTAVEIPESGGNAVIEVAKEQVGIMTGKTYWKWYFKSKFINTDATPWCGTFVAWCYNAAGQYDRLKAVQKYGNLGYVPSYSWYADGKSKWVKRKKAKPGDVIVFGRNAHVGLVEGISDGYIITIEGNTGPTAAFGCGKAGAVCRKIYNLNYTGIKGIIRP